MAGRRRRGRGRGASRALPGAADPDDGRADRGRAATALGADSDVALWRAGFGELLEARRRARGAGAAPPEVRQRHGPARRARPRRADRAGEGVRGGRPRARRPLDPFRHRRRARLDVLRRAARALRARWPRRSAEHARGSSSTPPTAPRPCATRPPTSTWSAAGSRSTGSTRSRRDPAERGLEPALELRSYVADVKRFARRRQRRLRPDAGGRRERHLGRGAADRLRRRGAARPVQQRRGAGRRPPPSARRHGLDGQRDDRPRARDRVEPGAEAVLIGAQGDERILAEEVAAAARHDQLRGHLRDLGPGAARGPSRLTRRRERLDRRRSPSRRRSAPAGDALGGAAEAWIVGGAVRDAALGAEVTDLDLAVARRPAARPRERSPRAAGGHAFQLSAEFATWRALAPRRSWQVDVAALRGEAIEADLAASRLHGQRDRGPARRRAEPIDPHGGLADLDAALLRAVSERELRATTRCGCCAPPGSAPSSGSRSIPATVELARCRGRARGRAGRRAPVRGAAAAARRAGPAARARAARRARR